MVVDPPLIGPCGSLVSPIRVETISSGMPSSSAATIAITVRVPVPISWAPFLISTAPSLAIRTSALAPPPPAENHRLLAIPTPLQMVADPPRTRVRSQPIRSRAMSYSLARIGWSSFILRNSMGSTPSMECAAMSIICSRATEPCGQPGARWALAPPQLVRTPYSTLSISPS